MNRLVVFAVSVMDTCMAREQHLHGSRATLVRLTSDTCTAQPDIFKYVNH